MMNLKHAFAIRADEFWVSNLRNEEKEVHRLKLFPDNKVNELCGLISNLNITHLVYDTRNDLNKEELKGIKKRTGIRLIVNDSPEETRLVADVNLYPPVPQLKEWDWSGFEGSKILSGWEYVLLRTEFVAEHPYKSPVSKPQSVLLAFGSTDPFGLTERVLLILAENREIIDGLKFHIVAGPQFRRAARVSTLIDSLHLPADLLISPQNIADIYRRMDMAIISFGVTAYELVACEVPFLSVSTSEDHERSASLFESFGLSTSLGILNDIENKFELKFTNFLENYISKIEKLKKFNKEYKISNYNKIIHAITN